MEVRSVYKHSLYKLVLLMSKCSTKIAKKWEKL